MCWQCDHPGATWPDYIAHVRRLIETHGWMVQGVQRGRHRPSYAYTVGLTEHDRPELAVTGLPIARAVDLLNGSAGHLVHAQAPLPGEVVPLLGGLVIQIVQVAEPTAHFPVATELFGPTIQVLQLVYADDRGHWPWDVGFRGRRGGQPVLGPRAASAA
jgi:hypothetical protein